MNDLKNFKVELFKALSHNHRISIIDALREGEKNVAHICEILNIESSYASQQLSILKNKNIVYGRKDGSQVFYSIKDENMFNLLDIARCIFNNHITNLKSNIKDAKKRGL
jgi:DNA-binding transcriptional ArsR family regulator